MRVNNFFQSIQGEGRYTGRPVLFIRLSGCTRKCPWCDTKYHKEGYLMDEEKIIEMINACDLNTVVWTGGEPLMQRKAIEYVIRHCNVGIRHHLETNGDLLKKSDCDLFDYIAFSPKELKTIREVQIQVGYAKNIDIKVVTNLEGNMDMVPYADYLMPLTTNDEERNLELEKDVWDYCVRNNKKFCLRQHVKVWGIKKRGI